MADAKVAKEEKSPIVTVVDSLRTQDALLDEAIGKLSSKLEPILYPHQNPSKGEDIAVPESSPLVVELDKIASGFNEKINILREITNRIEL